MAIGPSATNSVTFASKYKYFLSRKSIWVCHLQNWQKMAQCVTMMKYKELSCRVLGYWLLLWFRCHCVPVAVRISHLATHWDTKTGLGCLKSLAERVKYIFCSEKLLTDLSRYLEQFHHSRCRHMLKIIKGFYQICMYLHKFILCVLNYLVMETSCP